MMGTMLISLPVFISVVAIAVPFLMMLGVIAVMPAFVVVADAIIIGIHVVSSVYVLTSRNHAAIDVLLAVIM